MKHTHFALLITGALLFGACTPASAVPAESTGEPEVTGTASTASDTDECLACHTDKQRLIDTAAPEPPAETESKGVG